jgi:uncharacterized BrkB/YihY/UPF0761 family membrane protein
VIGLLLWAYAGAAVLLLGAEFAAEHERLSAADYHIEDHAPSFGSQHWRSRLLSLWKHID